MFLTSELHYAKKNHIVDTILPTREKHGLGGQTASEVVFDSRIELFDLNNPKIDTHIASEVEFIPSEGKNRKNCNLEVKRPQRSFLASELNSSASITYGSLPILPYGKVLEPRTSPLESPALSEVRRGSA